jgi:hypothetical protein
VFAQCLHGADAVLWVPDFLTDVEGRQFHGFHLAASSRDATSIAPPEELEVLQCELFNHEDTKTQSRWIKSDSGFPQISVLQSPQFLFYGEES